MKKEDKSIIIEQIVSTVGKYNCFYVTDITALNAGQTSKLRRSCFNEGIKLVVVKNTLLKKALDSLDTNFEQLYPVLKGNSALMFSNISNAPAKLIKDFAKDKKVPALKAAYVEESFYIGPDQLEALIHIKSKNELIADVIALLQSPAKNVVSALQSGGNILHGVLKTLGEREN
jgi:large subunit ribosomal protein L10